MSCRVKRMFCAIGRLRTVASSAACVWTISVSDPVDFCDQAQERWATVDVAGPDDSVDPILRWRALSIVAAVSKLHGSGGCTDAGRALAEPLFVEQPIRTVGMRTSTPTARASRTSASSIGPTIGALAMPLEGYASPALPGQPFQPARAVMSSRGRNAPPPSQRRRYTRKQRSRPAHRRSATLIRSVVVERARQRCSSARRVPRSMGRRAHASCGPWSQEGHGHAGARRHPQASGA